MRDLARDSAQDELELFLDELGLNYSVDIETRTLRLILPAEDWVLHEDAVTQFAAAHGVDVSVIPFVDSTWKTRWRDDLSVVLLGELFSVVVPTLSGELPQSEIPLRKYPLVLEPGESFGVGTHATTALMAQMLEGVAPKLLGARVLDVGCGSGVLSIIAEKLGAAECVGIDIDTHAVKISAQNAQRNDCRVCHFSETPLEQIAGPFDVICCNIISSVQYQFFCEMLKRLAPQGMMLLSGILEEEHGEFSEFLEKNLEGAGSVNRQPQAGSFQLDMWRGYVVRSR